MTKPTVSKHYRKPVGLSDKAWIPPTPLHHVTVIQVTTLDNRLYTQHKGPNVTNPICQTYKNCSYKCAADCTWTLCHTTQHRAVLIIFPLNPQTITITRMLSSGGEDRKTCRESTVPCDGLARAAGLNVSVLNILHTLHYMLSSRHEVMSVLPRMSAAVSPST